MRTMRTMKTLYLFQINNVIAEATFLPLSAAYVWQYCSDQEDIFFGMEEKARGVS